MDIANGVRASSNDRERAVAALSKHASDGRLTFEEFEHRVDHVYRAVTTADIEAVLQDLPAPAPAATPGAQPRSRAPIWLRAEWATWAGVGLLCLGIWLLTSLFAGSVLYPWPMWVIGPWGAVLITRSFGPERRACGRSAHSRPAVHLAYDYREQWLHALGHRSSSRHRRTRQEQA
ncbi:DUF1707 SHOCT-like domain-containing protein [Hoyosella subflava]|uniref:DUF1707 domain-containing protein n=1 Tax=Hoyosella subflava (strain DSM 45089 / JCM 17490 / NBRC 109087 / DQS3-9A1) TaxID=443218 RepID=F6EJH3_HOYSD|nr:DUF1707 domain-containing protein [Hoyosella subflava]AEF39022.1 hypothetical protein AS9A_0567 [Hoyosella subflava DQS3-9A1]